MLNNQIKEKIMIGASEKMVEYQQSEKLRNELIKYIIDSAINVLNESEKELLEKYPNLIITQTNINLCGKEISEIEKDSSFPVLNYKNWGDYYTYFSVEVNDKNNRVVVPMLFRDWKDLKKDFPDIYEGCKKLMKPMLINKLRYDEKMNLLKKVLDMKSINLTELKKNYVELYNIAKL